MAKPILYVDFNEMLEPNLVLLSATDTKEDRHGNVVLLHEGLEIVVYMDDLNERGEVDDLIATGVVEKNGSSGWGSRAKWCCRIDDRGIRHQSEVKPNER